MQHNKSGYGRVFLLSILVAAVIFLPAVIWDRGYFIFLGDFNSQQIPFYQVAHRAVRSGNFGWNWMTDLGVNFIGSYSFYLLGSPFFWLTIPFPTEALPYLMAPLLVLKFGCAAITSYAWLKRQVKEDAYARIGALLYAFSSFSIYNIFFNHFHEPMIFFPLLLIGMDELMDHGSKGVFALSVALNAIVSYSFFVGEVVFMVVYFMVRVLTKGYSFTGKRFVQLVLEAVLGMLMSLFLFLPSVLVMLGNYRVNNYADGFDLWLYSNNQRIPAILFAFLFPNDLPSKQVMLPDASVRWTSLTAYLPMFGAAGTLAFLKTHRKNWLARLIVVLFIMALVPAFNSLFMAFNKAYYARWFYMFTLMLVLATVRMLDEERALDLERSTLKLLILTAVIVLILALTPDKLKDGTWRIGIFTSDTPWQFAVMSAVALISLGALLLMLGNLREDPPKFVRQITLAICILSALYGNFYIIWGKTRSYDTHNYFIPDVIEGSFDMGDGDEVYRIDADDSVINIGMFWDVPDIRAFHSLVPASTFEFYEWIDEKRGVKSVPSYDNYAIRSLVSVKYFVDAQEEGDDFISTTNVDGTDVTRTVMPGYTKVDEQNHYDIYVNDNYIPMGFAYDSWCTRTEAEEVSQMNRGLLMLQCLVVEDDTDYTYVSRLLHETNPQDLPYNEDAYAAACSARKQQSCIRFEEHGDSFNATFESGKDTLLFISVPYDAGWNATVNGEEVPIIRANVGFMAVPVSAGTSEIEFTYTTPGLHIGIVSAICGWGIWILYLAAAKVMKKKARENQ